MSAWPAKAAIVMFFGSPSHRLAIRTCRWWRQTPPRDRRASRTLGKPRWSQATSDASRGMAPSGRCSIAAGTMAWKTGARRCVTASTATTCRFPAGPWYCGNSPNGPSGARAPASSRPSITISARAGTRTSLVRRFATSSGRPSSAPATVNSSVSIGTMAWLASSVAGSTPMAMATGRSSPRASAASWKRCRSRGRISTPSRSGPLTCSRLIETFCRPVSGLRAITRPAVM